MTILNIKMFTNIQINPVQFLYRNQNKSFLCLIMKACLAYVINCNQKFLMELKFSGFQLLRNVIRMELMCRDRFGFRQITWPRIPWGGFKNQSG